MSGETEKEVSGWTTDTLRMALTRDIELLSLQFTERIHALERQLDERYATQVKALDAAFHAQQTAMTTAFTAADKAVVAALESAEKAVTKAETASEKRFDSVNEFRGQLADQAATFMPRTESTARWQALSEKFDTFVAGNDSRMSKLESRMENALGRDQGGVDSQARAVAIASALAAVISVLVVVFTLLSR